ncbi:MAG: ArnT family glycosyltransferase, partial [Planctomycetota bacterium]
MNTEPEDQIPESCPGKTGGLPDRAWIAILFGLSLASRFVAVLQTRVINPDGVEFTRIAAAFRQGDFQEALAHPHHPLYPFLVSLAHAITGEWFSAAALVSLTFGALASIPLYLLLTRIVGTRPALFAGGVYAFLPPFVRFGADAITETTFHFFFLSRLALFAGRKNAPALPFALLGGVSAALAYITRPEGVGIPLALGCWVILVAIRRSPGSKRAALAGALFLAGFLAVSSPYLLH